MNITKKTIIVDTNILTDLNNAKILDKFVNIDNVYISDLVKSDEVNYNTGDVELIKKIKVIETNSEQIMEVSKLSTVKKKLSLYDLINYVIARDNKYILATGDNRLKNYSEENGVEVIRTLKIIKLMKDNDIISAKEANNACILLKESNNTRIPIDEIDKFIKKL